MRKSLSKLAHFILPFHIVMYIRYTFFNTFQNKTDQKLRYTFYSQFINSGDLVFDIGANLGNRIDSFLKLGAKVVAIEPQLKCIKYLKLKYNRKINIVQKGVAQRVGKASLFVSSSNALSTFSKDWIEKVNSSKRFGNHTWNDQVEVELTTVDELIKKFGTPKFVKIDVEGYELDVLKGLNKAIKYLSLEYAVPENIDGLLACIERLYELNSEVRFNFSVRESMMLNSEKWFSYSQMVEIINSKEFIDTNFGDIYAKN